MAEEQNQTETLVRSAFPLGRVKKIIKLDRDIKKVNSEALFLIALSTDLFLQFLAEKSSDIAVEKKRKSVRIEHMRIATKRHQPTCDFLLDSLPMPSSQPSSNRNRNRTPSSNQKSLPAAGTRRIEDFFTKSVNETD